MKRSTLLLMLICLSTPILAEEAYTNKKPQEEKKEEPDSASLIVGTILHSVIPHLINAVAAEKEAGDTETALQEVGSAVQGAGALVLALSKALKRNPHLTPELCLLAYLRSEKGKLFLSKHRSLL